LREKDIEINEHDITKEALDDIIRKFYVEVSVRKKDGSWYSESSLVSIRFGIQRKFKEIQRNIDIINDPEFVNSSEVFKAQCVKLKKGGLAKITHKHPICEEDLQKLYSSSALTANNPKALQRKVFFDLMLHTCRRGQKIYGSSKNQIFQLSVGLMVSNTL